MTAAFVTTFEPPVVTTADDRDWFALHQHRRYRARRAERGIWIVRKRSGGTFLRTWVPALPQGLPDTDKALRVAWFDAAWPDLDPLERGELVRAARADNA